MTRQDLIGFCLTFPSAYEDYPFDDLTKTDNPWTIMRHQVNKKSFACIHVLRGRLCVNLKCDPIEADFLRGSFKDVEPGFHMNKTHWNTVYPDGDVPEDELHRMISNSYDLIKPKRKGRGE